MTDAAGRLGTLYIHAWSSGLNSFCNVKLACVPLGLGMLDRSVVLSGTSMRTRTSDCVLQVAKLRVVVFSRMVAFLSVADQTRSESDSQSDPHEPGVTRKVG